MGNSDFRKPLTQSAAILCGVVILIALISSSNPGAGILAFFSGIGSLILLLIGLSIALPFSIAILVAIFLGAVYLQSREQAAEMYTDLKKNLPSIFLPLTNRWSCCSKDSNTSISQEEQNIMEQEITQLKENNVILENRIKGLDAENLAVKKNLSEITEQNSKKLTEITEHNSTLKEQLAELNQAMTKLQDSEKELDKTISTLRAEFDQTNDSELKEQIAALQHLSTETNTNLDDIAERLAAIEIDDKQAPTSGIFSYIDKDADKHILIKAIQEAIAQEMTYAQIDEFLSTTLDSKLNKIVKDHPSLTKNYIRNMKRD